MPKYAFADDKPVKTSGKKSKKNNSSPGGGGKLNASLGAKLERHFGNETVRQYREEQKRGSSGRSRTGADEQSLTYSVSSSVGGGSQTGESTDSSFADIMKVLDLNDTAEIVALMEAEGITDMTAQEYVERAQARAAMHRNRKAAGVSVADSLAYSVDGESTIADNSMYGQYNQRYGYGATVGGRYSPNMQSGQPSSERGGFGVMESLNASSEALVSPTTIRDDRAQKWESPKRSEKNPLPLTPKGKVKKVTAATEFKGEAVTTPKKDISLAPTAESSESTNSADLATTSTPQPRAPSERKQSNRSGSCSDDDDIDPMDCSKNGEWHDQWWMCGFGEAIRDVLTGNEPGKKPTNGRSSNSKGKKPTNGRSSSRSMSPKETEIRKARRGEC